MSADEMVINMVNAPHERRKQLQAKSKAAKRERQRKAREKAHRANVIDACLLAVLKAELVILCAGAIFLMIAG